MHSAPKSRDVKAWANGQVKRWNCGRSAEARNKYWSTAKAVSCRAFSASGFAGSLPGALPQAVALRTFGAD